MKSWKTLKTEVIEENKHLRFFVDDFETPAGVTGKYFYHTNAYSDGAINIFLQKEEDLFVMIREYRYLFDKVSVSQPQGSIDPNEDPAATAKREAAEETGWEPQEVISLGWLASGPAFSKERAHSFFGRDLKHVGQKLDQNESIEVVEMTSAQIDEAILSGEIWDGQVVAGWYMVKNYLAQESKKV